MAPNLAAGVHCKAIREKAKIKVTSSWVTAVPVFPHPRWLPPDYWRCGRYVYCIYDAVPKTTAARQVLLGIQPRTDERLSQKVANLCGHVTKTVKTT
jgi:hypothetical protein